MEIKTAIPFKLKPIILIVDNILRQHNLEDCATISKTSGCSCMESTSHAKDCRYKEDCISLCFYKKNIERGWPNLRKYDLYSVSELNKIDFDDLIWWIINPNFY
jgi:hypothetical protein